VIIPSTHYNSGMASTILRQIRIRRWFPAGDQLAACVARMSILREDFAIEMMGIYEEQISPLDGNTEPYRKIYFWRNMLRTLAEIKSVVFMLNSLPEFRAALETQPPERRRQFRDLHRQFERTNVLLKALRNDIGGHIRHEKVMAALSGMPIDKWGYLELREVLGKTHYRFAEELVLEMQITGLPDEDRIPEIERQLRETAKLLPVFALMELVFAVYTQARKLHE
jgi:hypothetical protein